MLQPRNEALPCTARWQWHGMVVGGRGTVGSGGLGQRVVEIMVVENAELWVYLPKRVREIIGWWSASTAYRTRQLLILGA
jgi:hypothetical protein